MFMTPYIPTLIRGLSMRRLGLLFLLSLIFASAFSQSVGTLSGTIVDEETGEPIIGANILLVGTTLGTVSDLDGKFAFGKIPIGVYDVKISIVGYTTKIVRGVRIETEVSTRLDVILQPEVLEGEEVVITANALYNTESALLQQQRKAPVIRDGISEEQIKKTPDATSSDLLRRISGVSIVDNKFVYVRGTSDRYNNALLNGVRLSSTEPDKKSFTFDLVPANFIENATVTKTFLPDLPGDFSGGLVQLNTIGFPEKRVLKLSLGSSWNTRSTRRDFLTYEGGPTDWLGYDNSHRALPNNFPTDFQNLSQEQKNELAKSLDNLWVLRSSRAPYNGNLQISYGNTITLDEHPFGYIASLTYRKGFTRTEVERADYDDAGLRYQHSGNIYKSSVVLGGLLNLSYKLDERHKFSSKSVFTQLGEDEVVRLEGFNNLQQNDEALTSMRYISRNVFSTQLEGEHSLSSLNNIVLTWRGSYGRALRDEPDLRRIVYVRSLELPDAQYEAQIPYNTSSFGSSSRFFSTLIDFNKGVEASLMLPVWTGKTKFGGLMNTMRREFNARNFVYTMPVYNSSLTESALDTLFIAGHIGGKNGLQFDEYYDRRNRYTAGQTIYATFAMLDFPLLLLGTEWRLIGGVRLENSYQTLHSGNLQNEDVDVEYKTIDLLPSINAIYIINTMMNLRFAYSKTVNRQEFREFAPFAFYDFSTQLTTYGNPNLKRALVDNYDVRWEMFPDIGELLSISYFHKKISHAIEQVVVATVALAGERTFENAPTASNYGFEVEMRKSLAFLGGYFSNFSVSANYTRVFSEVDLGDRKRPLQGQSPYTLNFGLYFTEPTLGSSVNVAYNKFGERISEVATVYTLDVKEQPRDVVDITFTQPLFETFELKLSGKDILQQEQVFLQGDERVRSNNSGATYAVGFSIKL